MKIEESSYTIQQVVNIMREFNATGIEAYLTVPINPKAGGTLLTPEYYDLLSVELQGEEPDNWSTTLDLSKVRTVGLERSVASHGPFLRETKPKITIDRRLWNTFLKDRAAVGVINFKTIDQLESLANHLLAKKLELPGYIYVSETGDYTGKSTWKKPSISDDEWATIESEISFEHAYPYLNTYNDYVDIGGLNGLRERVYGKPKEQQKKRGWRLFNWRRKQ